MDDYEYKPEDDGYSHEGEGEEDRYYITEPTKFAKHLGRSVAREGGFEMRHVKKLITVRQIKNYIKEVGRKDGKSYSISTEELDEIFIRIHEHIVGYDLTKAAASGMLEMYWDDKLNNMMFTVSKHDHLLDPDDLFGDY